MKIFVIYHYENGRFAEALALYDTAISIDPNKASYRSNKSHALTALGKLLEAAFECREAIRIDPYYQRAHNRLATLYTRLGEAEKAAYHFKQAGAKADSDSMNKSSSSSEHLCTEAKRQRDWNTLVKEAALAIAAGADSAPLIARQPSLVAEVPRQPFFARQPVVGEAEGDLIEEEMEGMQEEPEPQEDSGHVREGHAEIVDAAKKEEHHEDVKEKLKRKEFEIFVGGLDKDATEDDLTKVFSEVGNVTDNFPSLVDELFRTKD
ncbi:Kinesin light chain [Forsythia ovata]|uniref:Kinesin light chain n=1 Tax=Forsythia ovata TaxID=205694 RepID=A0ABD1U9A0_9LAMI